MTKDTTAAPNPATTKRASPVPEPETAALRAVRNVRQLNEQIAYRRMKEDMERQEAYLADKQMRYMERLHQQRLAEQAGTVRGHRPLMKNNWYS